MNMAKPTMALQEGRTGQISKYGWKKIQKGKQANTGNQTWSPPELSEIGSLNKGLNAMQYQCSSMLSLFFVQDMELSTAYIIVTAITYQVLPNHSRHLEGLSQTTPSVLLQTRSFCYPLKASFLLVTDSIPVKSY